MATSDRTSHLKTALHERTKNFIVYDGDGRMTENYEAHADAVTGTPCLLTRYAYDGLTSRILKRVEQVSTWNASYDYP